MKTRRGSESADGASVPESRDRDLFNDIAESYCRKDLAFSSRIPRKHRLLRTLSVIPWRPGLKILEVGCGCGFSADYLQGFFADYTGVDYADRLIAYARTMNGRDRVRFVAVDINEYHPEEKADVIIMIGVLHHFDDHEKSFAHILGMLKPGGWLVINEPHSGNRLIQWARKARAVLDQGYSREQKTFSAEQLKTLFERHGLDDLRISPQGVFSTPLAEVVLKPALIFQTLARVAVLLDGFLEKAFDGLLMHISWNLVAAARKHPDEI